MNRPESLVSKLKTKGDVTSREAFEVWKRFYLYNLKGRVTDVRYLTDWYRMAHILLAKGKTGHFIESIPTERCQMNDNKMSIAIEGCRKYIKHQEKEIEVEPNASFENISFSDLVFHKGRMILFRCGIDSLLKGKTKYPEKEPCFRTFDGAHLLELTEKDDITKEEADWIYDYVDLANTDTYRFYRFDYKPLRMWFDSVFEKLKAGKKGNFISTLPIIMRYEIYDRDELYKMLSPEELFHTLYVCNDGRVKKIETNRAGVLSEYIKDIQCVGEIANAKPGIYHKSSPAFAEDAVKIEVINKLRLPMILTTTERWEDYYQRISFVYSNDNKVKKIINMDIKDICFRVKTVEEVMDIVIERLMRQEMHDMAENDEWMETER